MSVFAFPAPGPLNAGGPFSGFTAYGFDIPQGDAGAIAAAATSAARLGQAFGAQARALNTAARVALEADGGWLGSASARYADYSGHLISTLSANATACDRAGSALHSLSDALTRAQSLTRQALADCERDHTELVTQQTAAQTAGAEADAALRNAAAAPHPSVADAFHQQAAQASRAQGAAARAASTAQDNLVAAQGRGQRAWEAYLHEAAALGGRLAAAAGELRPAPVLAGGAPVPITSSPAEVALATQILAIVGASRASGPLINSVPADERTPGLVAALMRDETDQTDSALAGGGARGPYSLWSSNYFGNSTASVNAAVTAGLMPPMPSNWGSMNLQPREAFWSATSRFFPGVTCDGGFCSAVKVTGTGTANFSQVVHNAARISEWAAVGLCVFGSDGACIGATKFAFGADSADDAVNATSLPNFLGREGVTTAELVVAGPGLMKATMGSTGALEGLLPRSVLGRYALNGFLTGPGATVTALAPQLDTRVFPSPPPKHHHG